MEPHLGSINRLLVPYPGSISRLLVTYSGFSSKAVVDTIVMDIVVAVTGMALVSPS